MRSVASEPKEEINERRLARDEENVELLCIPKPNAFSGFYNKRV